MDDPFEKQSPLGGLNIGRLIVNLLTGLFLVASLCLGTGYVAALINPQISFNPYPPPTLPPTLGPPTPTNTPAIYLPTEIPPSATPRPLPTAIPPATETPTVSPTATPELTPPVTAEPGAQFELLPGSPVFQPDLRSCDHMGVGGHVYDSGGSPIVGLAIRLGGQLASVPIGPLDTLSGSASDRFGFGGYYFEISDTPTASDGTIWVQILDASSGLPLSNQVFLDTFATCDQNLIFVSWKQTGS